jgi:hypothetical protein
VIPAAHQIHELIRFLIAQESDSTGWLDEFRGNVAVCLARVSRGHGDPDGAQRRHQRVEHILAVAVARVRFRSRGGGVMLSCIPSHSWSPGGALYPTTTTTMRTMKVTGVAAPAQQSRARPVPTRTQRPRPPAGSSPTPSTPSCTAAIEAPASLPCRCAVSALSSTAGTGRHHRRVRIDDGQWICYAVH